MEFLTAAPMVYNMTCHNCRHSREIARLAEEQARLREICSKCTLGNKTAGGGGVSLDTIQDGTAARVLPVVPNRPTSYTFDPGEIDESRRELDAETRARDALHTLLSCLAQIDYKTFTTLFEAIFTAKSGKVKAFSPEEFGIFAHLLNGGTMIDYAEAHGMTKQTSFARIKTLFNSRPVFRAIANGGLTHGKGGRVAVPRPEYQTDFFDKLEGC